MVDLPRLFRLPVELRYEIYAYLSAAQPSIRGTAERGPEKVERGRRWNAGKRSAVLNLYPYRTRISSYI